MVGSMLIAALLAAALPNPYEEPVPIGGMWQFRAEGEEEWSQMKVPGTWVGTPYEEYGGWAEYRTEISFPPTEAARPVALLISGAAGAGEVHVAGQLLDRHGSPPPDFQTSYLKLFVYDLPATGLTTSATSTLELRYRVYRAKYGMLQNPYYTGFARAGLAPPNFYVGPREDLERVRDQILLSRYANPTFLLLIVLSVLLITLGLVHLAIFAANRRDRAMLWFAVGAILLSSGPLSPTVVRIGTDRVIDVLTFAWWANVAGRIAFVAFFYSLFRIGRRVAQAYVASFLVASSIIWSIPEDSPMRGLEAPFSVVFQIALVAFIVYTLGSAWRRRLPEAGLLLVGFALAATSALGGIALFRLFGVHSGVTSVFMGGSALAVVATVTLALARRTARQVRELGEAYDASRRFVPGPFLELLGRKEVVEVQRGDATSQVMTVMFADLRGFTARAEGQSPDETLAFLNRYLAIAEPILEARGGFVNQYYGDGVMALFSNADDALGAAVELVESVGTELVGLEVGVGLHTGPLVLGTIGGSTRLDTGVVGDTVNVASRVEGLTKQHGRRVLLTGETRDALSNADVVERVAEAALKNRTAQVQLFAPRAR